MPEIHLSFGSDGPSTAPTYRATGHSPPRRFFFSNAHGRRPVSGGRRRQRPQTSRMEAPARSPERCSGVRRHKNTALQIDLGPHAAERFVLCLETPKFRIPGFGKLPARTSTSRQESCTERTSARDEPPRISDSLGRAGTGPYLGSKLTTRQERYGRREVARYRVEAIQMCWIAGEAGPDGYLGLAHLVSEKHQLKNRFAAASHESIKRRPVLTEPLS